VGCKAAGGRCTASGTEAKEQQLFAAQGRQVGRLIGALDRIPLLENLGRPTSRDRRRGPTPRLGEWPGRKTGLLCLG